MNTVCVLVLPKLLFSLQVRVFRVKVKRIKRRRRRPEAHLLIGRRDEFQLVL